MKNTIISIIAAGALIGFAIIISNGRKNAPEQNTSTSLTENSIQKNTESKDINTNSTPTTDKNISGYQIIEITAKGGYTPRKSIAKAGIPTILRFNTKGTFDCSSSIRIPSLGISKILPQNGSTDIDIGTNKASTLQGSCGMGMYPFEIEFQ